MSITLDGVEVELGRLDTDWRKFGITVKVFSRRKPGLKATNQIDPGAVGNAQALIQMVGAAGGACAEYLGKRYKDNIDPSVAANLAMKAFVEEMRLAKELTQQVPAKLRRLLGQEAKLNNNEQELITRLQWMVDHGQELTPREVRAVDSIVARLHSGLI